MDDASAATFRPTWQQALCRGALVAAMVVTVALAVVPAWTDGVPPPVLIAIGAASVPMLLVAAAVRRSGVQITAGGIRKLSAFSSSAVASWDEVVDMRAERRGARTVVSVYLGSGESLRLEAPYTGELLAADPRFEGKMIALSCLWRSHRFGGLPG